MLEDRSNLVSRGYSITCDPENNNWDFMKCKTENGKRPLEIDGDEQKDECKKTKKPAKDSDLVIVVDDGKDGVSEAKDPAKDCDLVMDDDYRKDGVNHAEDLVEDSDSVLDSSDVTMSSPKDSDCQKDGVNEAKDPAEDTDLAMGDNYPKDGVNVAKDPAEDSDSALDSCDVTMSSPKDSDYRKDGVNEAKDPAENQSGNSSDSDLLINEIGPDNSISCLIRCSRADYCSIASLNSRYRALVRNGELYKLRRKHGIIEHWVYISCNLLEWEAFDPNRRKWMRLPRMHSNECFFFSDKESLAVGTELLVFGKEVFSNVIYKYSLLTNTWSSGMKMNDPRCLFGSASLGEVAIIAGGCDSFGKALGSAEMYNSEKGVWETLPNLHRPRKMCSGVFMDGKFYVIGGSCGNDSLTCGEEFDLDKKVWSIRPNMSPVRTGTEGGNVVPGTPEAPPLIAVVNNELYSADHAPMELRKYDKGNRIWVTIGRLPEMAASMNGWGLAFRACGDKLICIGGPQGSGPGFIEVNAWVPSEGPCEWTLLSRKQSASFIYNCAVMGC